MVDNSQMEVIKQYFSSDQEKNEWKQDIKEIKNLLRNKQSRLFTYDFFTNLQQEDYSFAFGLISGIEISGYVLMADKESDYILIQDTAPTVEKLVGKQTIIMIQDIVYVTCKQIMTKQLAAKNLGFRMPGNI